MPTYYVRGIDRGAGCVDSEFWCVEENIARPLGVAFRQHDVGQQYYTPGGSPTHRDPNDPDMITTLRKRVPWGRFHELCLLPGEYFPRVARPDGLGAPSPGYNPDPSTDFRHSLSRSKGQLHAFIQSIEHICRVVHPSERNLSSYGHEIANVLMLACTEVEAHWKNVLKANRYRTTGKYDNLTTGDYIKLLAAMRLNEYEVRFNYYPWLDDFSPFAAWSMPETSKSLRWYRAYNNVKHDREGHFPEATLYCGLSAVAACFVMLCAQYGLDFMLPEEQAAGAFFQLTKAPQWGPCEIYVPSFGRGLHQKFYEFHERGRLRDRVGRFQ